MSRRWSGSDRVLTVRFPAVTVLSDTPTTPVQTSPAPSPVARRTLLVWAVVGVGLAGIVCYAYTRSDLWLDEALSVNVARLPLSQLRGALRHDGAPPLYYVLLHGWMAVFGTGNEAVRSLSAVCMIGAAVVTWFVVRRVAGPRTAWLSAVVFAVNPYAIRYATETRMYALEILLVASGILLFQRSLEDPSPRNLAGFAAVVGLGCYTQYWVFYMLVVVVAALAFLARRGVHARAARRLLLATAVGVATFLPWLPTFLYQRAHTGTPWGKPVFPGLPLGFTLLDFSGGAVQEGWIAFPVVCVVLAFGVFGFGLDRRRIEIDLRARPEIRGLAAIGISALVVALSLNYLAGGAFQTRYSALVFPFFVVIVARGIATFRDIRVRAVVLAFLVAVGLRGGVRNMTTQRTQADTVATVLRAEAHAGDLVVYCPDQLGPSVHRLVQPGLREVVYPSFAPPDRVDWVDYKARLARTDVGAFASEALAKAGRRTLWLVSAPGYITHEGTCEKLSTDLGLSRPPLERTLLDDKVFEKAQLEEFLPIPPRG